jgi:hypothetical protein
MQGSPSSRSAQGERDHTVRGVCGDGNVRPIERTAPDRVEHYRRPVERPFLASERGRVTVLFGGLTGAHDRLIQSVFESCGYRAQALPQADLEACHIGRQYCNNGLCNPAYFTIGTLIRHLQQLEAAGLARPEIVDRYVFFTASSCGPCRFGMYESEYRLALRNAGFEGFRVLVFQQDHGLKADTGEPGLKFTLHFGLAAANAHDARRCPSGVRARAAAVRNRTPGAPTRGSRMRCGSRVGWRWPPGGARGRPGAALAARRSWARAPPTSCSGSRQPVRRSLPSHDPRVPRATRRWRSIGSGQAGREDHRRVLGADDRRGRQLPDVPFPRARRGARAGRAGRRMGDVSAAVGAGRLLRRRGLSIPRHGPPLARAAAHVREDRGILWRLAAHRGGRAHLSQPLRPDPPPAGGAARLLDSRELVRLAEPYYRQFARGGEGHLEVGKNIHYTHAPGAHMVLSLKPFGCMPSTQSDGVQASLLARFPDMLFLPIETGAEGELARRAACRSCWSRRAPARRRSSSRRWRHGPLAGRDSRVCGRSSGAEQAGYLVPHRPASRASRRTSCCTSRSHGAPRRRVVPSAWGMRALMECIVSGLCVPGPGHRFGGDQGGRHPRGRAGADLAHYVRHESRPE